MFSIWLCLFQQSLGTPRSVSSSQPAGLRSVLLSTVGPRRPPWPGMWWGRHRPRERPEPSIWRSAGEIQGDQSQEQQQATQMTRNQREHCIELRFCTRRPWKHTLKLQVSAMCRQMLLQTRKTMMCCQKLWAPETICLPRSNLQHFQTCRDETKEMQVHAGLRRPLKKLPDCQNWITITVLELCGHFSLRVLRPGFFSLTPASKRHMLSTNNQQWFSTVFLSASWSTLLWILKS